MRGKVKALLTVKQAEVLKYAAEGLSNKEIGRKLGISECTVNDHLKQVFTALNTHKRGTLWRHAVKLGLVVV